jgi:hypothetical protein
MKIVEKLFQEKIKDMNNVVKVTISQKYRTECGH